MAKDMFRFAWDQRLAQAQDAIRSGQRRIKDVEKQIEVLLTRIMDTTSTTVVGAYEQKISDLDHGKAILADQLANQAEPKGSYEEKLEPVLTFLANPWKLWETGHAAPRRTVLKLAFADRIQYHRNEGARTAEISFLFKVLGGIADSDVCFGAQKRTRTSTSLRTLAPEASASTIPPSGHGW